MRQRVYVSWVTSAHHFVNWLELLRHTDKPDGTGFESGLAGVG
jgi:hypothetical protein